MAASARRSVSQSRRARSLAFISTLAAFGWHSFSHAQVVGPIVHDGYVEYRYDVARRENAATRDQHLAHWQGRALTYLWQPWIVQLEGTLGLSRARGSVAQTSTENTIITGGFITSVFPQSRFPLRAFYERRDSRINTDDVDQDLVTTTYGFLQQYSFDRGGRMALEYRGADSESLRIDGIRDFRKFDSDLWRLSVNRAMKQNIFNFEGVRRDFSGGLTGNAEQQNLLTLRHRFRTSERFFIEDTTIFNDTKTIIDPMDAHRSFLQFNGAANWRPATKKPFLLIGRVFAQFNESGPDGMQTTSERQNVVLTANYQMTSNLRVLGDFGAVSSEVEDSERTSSYYQRFRATYTGNPVYFQSMRYNWGGFAQVGNRRFPRHDGDDRIQDWGAGLNHALSYNATLDGYRQLQVGVSQSAEAYSDTAIRRDRALIHGAHASLNRQNGRRSSYARLSFTDRRTSGNRSNVFQLVTLQYSATTQVNRKRSWSGGVSIQYSNTSTDMLNHMERRNQNVTYGADLNYTERDLFGVTQLNFFSDLRLLSSNLVNEEMRPDFEMETTTDRENMGWRNELTYRIGLLEFRLLASAFVVDDDWRSQYFFGVRRYYGNIR
jgi:hypothetical protein